MRDTAEFLSDYAAQPAAHISMISATAYAWREIPSATEVPGTVRFYWRSSTRMRCVYNVPHERAGEMFALILGSPDRPYREIVGTIPGAMFGDESATLETV